MPISASGTIKHRFQTAQPNRTDIDVSKDRWNDSEVLTGGSDGLIVMREAAQTDGWGWAPQIDLSVAANVTILGATSLKWSADGGGNIGDATHRPDQIFVKTSVTINTAGYTVDKLNSGIRLLGAGIGFSVGTTTGNTTWNITSDDFSYVTTNTADLGRNVPFRSGYFGTSVVSPLLGTTTDALTGIQVNGGIRWYVGASTSAYTFFPNSDNANDIANSTSRVRSGYFGTALIVGTNPSTTGALRLPHLSQINGRDSTNTTNVIIADWGSTTDTLLLGQTGFDTQIGGRVRFTSAGPHAIGSATNGNVQLTINGTFVPVGGANTYGLDFETSLAPQINGDGIGHFIKPTFVEAGSGTHSLFSSLRIDAATVTGGAATVTNTAGLYISGAMTATVTGKNYAAWFGGLTRIDGNLNFNGVGAGNVMLKPSATTMSLRYGDDSAYGDLTTGFMTVASAYIGPGTVATTGDFRAQQGFEFDARNNANSANAKILSFGALGTVDQAAFGDRGFNSRVSTNGTTPGSLANGDWWIESSAGDLTTTTIGTTLKLMFRHGSATRTIATFTY